MRRTPLSQGAKRSFSAGSGQTVAVLGGSVDGDARREDDEDQEVSMTT